MLTVWGRRSSFNLQKVMWLVGELGLEHRHIAAGGQFGGLDAPEFRAMNPHGRVPVIDDDGMIVWESHAILRYLAARHGRDCFWSDDPGERSQVDRWMDWSQTALQPDFLMGVFWGFYRTPEAQRNWPAIRDKVNRCAQHFRLLDAMLAHRPFLCGDALTLADIPAGTSLYRYFELDIERPSVPNWRHGTGAWGTDRHIASTSWFRSTSCAAVSIIRAASTGPEAAQIRVLAGLDLACRTRAKHSVRRRPDCPDPSPRAIADPAMSEFTPAVLAALLAFGASSALAQTSSLPPLPELKFVEIPAASRANYLGDRWSYMEAGRADAPPVVLPRRRRQFHALALPACGIVRSLSRHCLECAGLCAVGRAEDRQSGLQDVCRCAQRLSYRVEA